MSGSKPKKYNYDEQCLLLAEYFLSDERKRPDYDTAVNELAQDIQDCVEGFFSSRLVQL